ncbi:histidinol phosphate phosphatase, HisJ family [Anaerobranca californiensis DSM 14826]|jgi:histidinol-phosphatase (PHP family)|uniref:Histidinol phosphate phosphatase, HisJ family n=1 Tax=Anaerobranca californiensis DSM 14826 TaxID=1120989 RepID=A0A1M6MPE3_9FIRM|nr:PHP domain-containing protein [Anaerobranca californiensis]SHJ85163.1 histidinol phosphate phosphatase, HisJ family [Anaerobranca californiensis DSM 14826]
MWDYHVHSSFSDDCHVEMETIVQKGISLGIKEICFTDHIDYEAAIPNVIIEFDNNDYSREVNRLKKNTGTKFLLRKGLKWDFSPIS